MLFSRRGSVHSVVFALVIICGFGLALGWPQYSKYREVSRAREALVDAAHLAYEQQAYADNHGGRYAQDWTALGLPLTCAQVTKDGVNVLECDHYEFFMQEGKVVARHRRFPSWFTYDPVSQKADCSHEDASLAGAHLCGSAL